MQILLDSCIIEEPKRKEAILEILSDKYCREIINVIMYKPKSAVDITAETNIPLSTVYRRIKTLQKNKLLLTSGSVNKEGKKVFLYKSKTKGIQCNLNEGKIELKLIFNS